MKTLLAIIGGLVVFVVAVLFAVGWLAEQHVISGAGPGPSGTQDGGAANPLKEALVGRWQVENGNLKGVTMLFTSSGATTWIIPADAFGLTDCTGTGTYKLFKFKGTEGHPAGTYVRSTLSDKSGNCKDNFKTLPLVDDSKLDVVDVNHLLFDTMSLVRVN